MGKVVDESLGTLGFLKKCLLDLNLTTKIVIFSNNIKKYLRKTETIKDINMNKYIHVYDISLCINFKCCCLSDFVAMTLYSFLRLTMGKWNRHFTV